jgi:rare lipoprotein A (peptidoglycan hydrolase)
VKIVVLGAFIRGRIIDVSPTAASALCFLAAGLAHVRVERN